MTMREVTREHGTFWRAITRQPSKKRTQQGRQKEIYNIIMLKFTISLAHKGKHNPVFVF
jgi:hypothetical protein